jgi:hypothetical protein
MRSRLSVAGGGFQKHGLRCADDASTIGVALRCSLEFAPDDRSK